VRIDNARAHSRASSNYLRRNDLEHWPISDPVIALGFKELPGRYNDQIYYRPAGLNSTLKGQLLSLLATIHLHSAPRIKSKNRHSWECVRSAEVVKLNPAHGGLFEMAAMEANSRQCRRSGEAGEEWA
jgi:hypothetical protein